MEGVISSFTHGLTTIMVTLLLEWTAVDEDQADIHVWEDNWDDDTVEDDFSNQLRYNVGTHKLPSMTYLFLICYTLDCVTYQSTRDIPISCPFSGEIF